MKFRLSKRMLVGLALLAALAVAILASSASAGTRNAGRTVVTTDPGTTRVLVQNGIVPLPVGGAGFGVSVFPFSLSYSFPITATSPGLIDHSGGLRFVNVRNGHSATVQNFAIDLTNDQLDADVVGVANGVPIANLSNVAVVNGVPTATVTLNATAESVLNGALGTSLPFSKVPLGTARVYLP
jgi:hypothetical protein